MQTATETDLAYGSQLLASRSSVAIVRRDPLEWENAAASSPSTALLGTRRPGSTVAFTFSGLMTLFLTGKRLKVRVGSCVCSNQAVVSGWRARCAHPILVAWLD